MSESAASSVASVACDVCGAGSMETTETPRYSTRVVVLGYAMWIPAAALLAFATAAVVLFSVPGSGSHGTANEMHNRALQQLREIRGLPEAVITEFETTDAVAPGTLSALPPEQRGPVEFVTTTYAVNSVSAGIRGAAIFSVVQAGVMLVYVVLVPLLVVGLLLTRKRTVRRCGACGHVVDRA